MDDRPDDDPSFDIAFALRRIHDGHRRVRLSDEDRKTLARRILDQLRQSGWRLTRGAPAPAHSWPPPGARIPGVDPM